MGDHYCNIYRIRPYERSQSAAAVRIFAPLSAGCTAICFGRATAHTAASTTHRPCRHTVAGGGGGTKEARAHARIAGSRLPDGTVLFPLFAAQQPLLASPSHLRPHNTGAPHFLPLPPPVSRRFCCRLPLPSISSTDKMRELLGFGVGRCLAPLCSAFRQSCCRAGKDGVLGGGGKARVGGRSGWSCCWAGASTSLSGGGAGCGACKGAHGVPRLVRPRWRADNENQGGDGPHSDTSSIPMYSAQLESIRAFTRWVILRMTYLWF